MVACNTVEFTTAFLFSDWLYFLWHAINICVDNPRKNKIMMRPTYRGFCSSSVSVGSGVFEPPLSLSFFPDGLFTSVFSVAAKFVALSLAPDLDEADSGLKVSGSSTSGKRAWSLTASQGILPENATR